MNISIPTFANALAVILVAIGVEVKDAQIQLILEALGVVVAAAGLLLGWLRAGRN